MPGSERLTKPAECGCATTADESNPPRTEPSAALPPETSLRNLIPVAVVIVGGCEKCAEAVAARALEQGSSTEDLETVLRIVARMREVECIVEAFGPDAIARMEKPLAAARRILQESAARARQ